MAYQKKYYIDYMTLKNDGVTNTLEFWQDTADILVAEEIKGAQSPFIKELPELNHKFQVVRGTGATISLLSDTDMKFFDGLEHIDNKEFKIIHKINGVVDWLGYLNADMQSEPYDIDFNYIVTMTANDGFALLDKRFLYDESGDKLTMGVYSKWYYITLILNTLGIAYNDIRVKLATTFADFSGGLDKTILHESFINISNFYDEDGKAMSHREVLEAILAPYGAFICQSGGSIYITDIHTMAGGGNVTFQKFVESLGEYVYSSDVVIDIEKDVTEIGYFGTGQSIERSGGTNMQKVIYSPYPVKYIIPESIVAAGEFATVPALFSDKDSYKYRTLLTHSIWKINSPADFEESCATLTSEHFIYARLPMILTDVVLLEFVDLTGYFLTASGATLSDVVSISGRRKRYLDGVALLITGEVLTKTKANPYSETYTAGELAEKANKVVELGLNFECSIGDLYYNDTNSSFEATPSYVNYIHNSKNAEVIANKWIPIGRNGEGKLIKLGNLTEEIVLNGYFNFKIRSNTKVRKQGDAMTTNDTVLKESWIRNLEIKLVNFDGSEIEDSDIEYIGRLDKRFSNEGEDITLKTGTKYGFADRAKIMRPNGDGYADILEWTRGVETYKIEELLLNSLCSNYKMNFLTLLNMNLKNEFGIMNVITDSTYLGTRRFMVKSANIDYANYLANVNLVEISQDILDIVKE